MGSSKAHFPLVESHLLLEFEGPPFWCVRVCAFVFLLETRFDPPPPVSGGGPKGRRDSVTGCRESSSASPSSGPGLE